jgi:hypothetical protein
MEVKLLLPEHVPLVFEFERGRLASDLSEMEIAMQSWDQSWRKESLEHYAELGWSFVALDPDHRLQGYVLGQPLLFFNNWTQSLWVEHLGFIEATVGEQLLDTVVRWAKSKHLQKVMVNGDSDQAKFAEATLATAKSKSYLHLSTTKLQGD